MTNRSGYNSRFYNSRFYSTFAISFAVILFIAVLMATVLTPESDKSDTPAPVVAEQTESTESTESTVTVHAPARELAYVEPLRKQSGYPSRVYVEFSDGTEHVFAPCAQEDSRDCFWWASARGNGIGESFVDFDGKTYSLKQGGE